MGTSPDRIRADIDSTRETLSHDLEQLVDRASPRRAARRRVDTTREQVTGFRDGLRDGIKQRMSRGDEKRGRGDDKRRTVAPSDTDRVRMVRIERGDGG